MTEKINLFQATLKDAPLVAHLHVSGWRDGYAGLLPKVYLDSLDVAEKTERWRKNLTDGSVVWIATLNGEPASVISYGSPLNPVPDGMTDCGEITMLYTLGKFYRQGLGNALFDYARISLAQRGFRSLYLWVLEDNMKGRFFYQKMGENLISGVTRSTMLNGQSFNEIAYAWTL